MTPFRIPFTNFVAVVAQYAILVTFMAALVLETDSLEKFGLDDFMLGLLLSLVNLCIIFLAFFIGWRRYRKERKAAKSELSKRVKMEWAAHFSQGKFESTFQFTVHRNVPQSHCLCFYFTSLEQAGIILKTGLLPALKETNGIVVSLWGPHRIVDDGDPSLAYMGRLAASREAVLCLSLPHHLLWSLSNVAAEKKEAHPSCEKLRLIPFDVLEALTTFEYHQTSTSSSSSSSSSSSGGGAPKAKQGGDQNNPLVALSSSKSIVSLRGSDEAMRGSDGASLVQQQQQHHHHHHHDQRQILALPTTCVLRAFQLEEWASASAQADSELLREGEADPATAALSRAAGAATAEVWQPATCAEYVAAMAAVRQVCDEEGAVPLYHYTSPESARFIVSSGLRMSTQGQGDGGVYFSTLGPASYDLGTSKYEENIIVDCFGRERLEEYRGKHKLDVW